jgi:hypothetical protein
MKTFIKLILTVCLIPLANFAHTQTAEFYQQKINHFENQHVIGLSLAGASIPVGTLGVYWIVHGSKLLDDRNGDDDVWGDFFNGFFQLVGGCVVSVVGIGLLAGGIVMITISGNRIEQYQQKLNGLNVGIICTPEQKGLAITFRF